MLLFSDREFITGLAYFMVGMGVLLVLFPVLKGKTMQILTLPVYSTRKTKFRLFSPFLKVLLTVAFITFDFCIRGS